MRTASEIVMGKSWGNGGRDTPGAGPSTGEGMFAGVAKIPPEIVVGTRTMRAAPEDEEKGRGSPAGDEGRDQTSSSAHSTSHARVGADGLTVTLWGGLLVSVDNPQGEPCSLATPG